MFEGVAKSLRNSPAEGGASGVSVFLSPLQTLFGLGPLQCYAAHPFTQVWIIWGINLTEETGGYGIPPSERGVHGNVFKTKLQKLLF